MSPILKDQKSAFDKQFAGMTSVEFTYNDYEETRAILIDSIQKRLTDVEKQFLISFEMGSPDWKLFQIPVLRNLPAIRWKLQNISNLKESNLKKNERMIENLRETLFKI